MTSVSLRTAIGAGAAALGAAIIPRGLRAAEFTYKYGNNLPVIHPMNLRAKEATDRIREQSSGRLDIEIFPSNQLGGDTDMLSQLRSGALEFLTLSGLILAGLVPIASINGVGFAFRDRGQVWPAMDGALGTLVRDAVSKAGLIAFETIWDNGFREITTAARPIAAPEDLAGLKIRVPVGALWTSLFRAFGAAPASMNFAEAYPALQAHVVDGQENPLAIIETARLYEVQRYCALTNHMWDGFWFLAHAPAVAALPRPLQELVTTTFNQAALAERADLARLDSSLRSTLEARGMAFTQPDPAPFQEVLRRAGFYAEWRRTYGDAAWATLERFAGALA